MDAQENEKHLEEKNPNYRKQKKLQILCGRPTCSTLLFNWLMSAFKLRNVFIPVGIATSIGTIQMSIF